MSKVKPSLPKGTRDFLPNEVMQRKYIFNTIRNVLEHYGFSEIETPAFERLETLTGKYGEEGDRLLFKILNSGDAFSKFEPNDIDLIQKYFYFKYDIFKNEDLFPNLDITDFQKTDRVALAPSVISPIINKMSEKGLRYDLTVPLARYVVQHQSDLVFPFKRYHVAPVWRADRPQRGRYQEFYQFDADIISADSLINDVELTQILIDVYKALGINVTIKINNRKILEALSIYADAKDNLSSITIAIDKLDKVGMDGVILELKNNELNDEQITKITQVLSAKSITDLSPLFNEIEIGKKGIEELQFIFNKIKSDNLIFDTTLARGLSYYTGTIWEVTANDVQMGSISGGGRYDNLTEMFGGQNMSGIGISFGVERIFDVMQELNLFSSKINKGVKVLVVARDENLTDTCYDIVLKMREAKIACEFFTGNVKKQKQMPYAIAKNIEYIMEIGEDEITNNIYRIKNIESREEQKLSLTEIIEKLK
jgi:histidyl-tRNA synthetase